MVKIFRTILNTCNNISEGWRKSMKKHGEKRIEKKQQVFHIMHSLKKRKLIVRGGRWNFKRQVLELLAELKRWSRTAKIQYYITMARDLKRWLHNSGISLESFIRMPSKLNCFSDTAKCFNSSLPGPANFILIIIAGAFRLSDKRSGRIWFGPAFGVQDPWISGQPYEEVRNV